MWDPQPGAQTSAILADWVDDLFFGGDRGGGKSDFQLGYQEDAALQYEGKSRGIMFRKTYPELEELQSRAMEIFPASGATYKTQPSAQYPFSNCWYWPNGASVKMRYMEHERDYGRYHGHQYTHVSFDEVTEYPTNAGLLKMLSTLRSPHGVPCSVRSTGNPGGVGHIWVKHRYISARTPYYPYKDEETGLTRMFIPSRRAENYALIYKDPNYVGRIMAATEGNEALRKAWIDGDWEIIAGAFFSELSANRHKLISMPPPTSLRKFRSIDWGSAKPFSIGWWAVSDGEWECLRLNGERFYPPRGAIIRYREWYGCELGNRNVGLKLDAVSVAQGIKDRTPPHEEIAYTVADPSMFIQNGGPSLAERFDGQKVTLRSGDNKRVTGWNELRRLLQGKEPMIYFMDNCDSFWETVPSLQHDLHNLEDIDTDMEDHVADEVRYAAMSRYRPHMAQESDTRPKEGSLSWLLEVTKTRAEKEKRGEDWREQDYLIR